MTPTPFHNSPGAKHLSWWERAGVDDLVRLLQIVLVGVEERGARQRHQSRAGRLEDAEGGDELHE